jgi:hypothetical protein
VETYFPTVGWVAFDPTPGHNIPYAGASSTSPGFTDPFIAGPSGSTTATTEAGTDQFPHNTATTTDTAPTSHGPSWISRMPWLPWVLGLVVLLAAWPFGRRLWLERGLHYGTLTQRFAASLRLLRGTLSSYGVPATASSTFEDLLDVIEERFELARDPVLAARAGAVLFGGRRARPEDIEQAEEFRHGVESSLRKRLGWMVTILTWYGVPPGARRAARGGGRAVAAETPAGAPARSPA